MGTNEQPELYQIHTEEDYQKNYAYEDDKKESAYGEKNYKGPHPEGQYVNPSAYYKQEHTTSDNEGCIDNYQFIRGCLGLLVICSAINFIKGPNLYDAFLIAFWMAFIHGLECQIEKWPDQYGEGG